MTLILLNDLQEILWAVLTAFVPLIVPLLVLSVFFHFTRSILFDR